MSRAPFLIGFVLFLALGAWARSPSHPPGDLKDRVIPFDLASYPEQKDVRANGKHGLLHPLANRDGSFHPEREPLVLVHGIGGQPHDLQLVAERFRDDARFQLYVFAYDSFYRRTSLNGDDLADELRFLERTALGPGRHITIVAHSMGGIVSRWAINNLSLMPEQGVQLFSQIRFIAIDTPWHGYPGPSDRGLEGTFARVASHFMPSGMIDMRANSAVFQGDPAGKTALDRAGLYGVLPPDNVSITLVFAAGGNVVLKLSSKHLHPIIRELTHHFTDVPDPAITGDAQLMNYWNALLSSDQYIELRDTLDGLADVGQLDDDAVVRALDRFFPKFPGDHTGVLRSPELLDYLTRALQ